MPLPKSTARRLEELVVQRLNAHIKPWRAEAGPDEGRSYDTNPILAGRGVVLVAFATMTAGPQQALGPEVIQTATWALELQILGHSRSGEAGCLDVAEAIQDALVGWAPPPPEPFEPFWVSDLAFVDSPKPGLWLYGLRLNTRSLIAHGPIEPEGAPFTAFSLKGPFDPLPQELPLV